MTHTLQAIAWTLIHFCWQAAAVAAVYRLASLALARSSSSTRYVAALLALLVMLVASVVTFTWELRATAAASLSSPASEAHVLVAATDLPHTMKPGFIPTQNDTPVFSPSSLLPWIDGLWIVGVVVLSLRSLGGWWLIQRLRRSATALAPAEVEASFSRIASALGLRRPVLLRVSQALAGPVTVGALRAMVLLPLSAVTSLGPDELEVVLAHELAHVRRADFFWNLIQTLAETLFFFHPAVWWIGSRIRYERELCCDDLALKVCPDPVVYASALFRLEQQRSRHWQMAMALDGHQSSQTLRMRIARILGEPTMPAVSRRVQPFSLAAACAALVILLLPAPHVLASLHAPAPVGAVPVAVAIQKPSAAHPAVAMLASPSPAAIQAAAPAPATVAPQHDVAVEPPATEEQDTERPGDSASPKGSYIDRMKATGYDVDLDKYLSMKIQNVTPEYARAMNQLGFGKLSADDLVACKIQQVSPEYIAQLKQRGLEVRSVHDAISYRIFQVTPEFVEGMKAAGFANLDSKQILALRVQGVTPEYARSIAQQYPGATVDDLVKTRIFRIDGDFIASAKKHGFTNLSLDKLVQLRISGLLDDESAK